MAARAEVASGGVLLSRHLVVVDLEVGDLAGIVGPVQDLVRVCQSGEDVLAPSGSGALELGAVGDGVVGHPSRVAGAARAGERCLRSGPARRERRAVTQRHHLPRLSFKIDERQRQSHRRIDSTTIQDYRDR